ncbi:hypothetical protein TNCV_97561 [Trichonephila clavipes]|nr:hypothetical protein TNCV_97561 [Trichonephila clavipes]
MFRYVAFDSLLIKKIHSIFEPCAEQALETMTSRKDSDKGIRLSEIDPEESEGRKSDVIDNIPVNPDIYLARDDTEWIPPNINVPGRFATRNLLRQNRELSENDSDGGELSCSYLDSDEDIKLSEGDCKISEERANAIDITPANPDIYMSLGGTEWIPHISSVPVKFATRNVLRQNRGPTSFVKHNVTVSFL